MPVEVRKPIPILYEGMTPDLVHTVRSALLTDSLVLVSNFPAGRVELSEFSSQLGSLMPKYQKTSSNLAEDFVGVVQIRPDISEQDRLSTEKGGELKPHTAKSWGLIRPHYFGLLMVDPGWTDMQPGLNGESILVRWQDVIKEMQRLHPQTFAEDYRLLTQTNVRFTATHLKDDIADMPIIFPIDSAEDLGVRYKENMVVVLSRLAPEIPNGRRFLEAVLRFDQTARNCDLRWEFAMAPGDLYVIDNRRVGHARRDFVPFRLDSQGQTQYNPRLLYNIHILG